MNKSWLYIFTLFTVASPVLACTCTTKRESFFEKKDVKAWATEICPHERLPFHTHAYARVLIAKNDGTLKVVYKNASIPSITIRLHKNKPVYLDASEGHYPHQDINIGKKPLGLTVIELKTLAKD